MALSAILIVTAAILVALAPDARRPATSIAAQITTVRTEPDRPLTMICALRIANTSTARARVMTRHAGGDRMAGREIEPGLADLESIAEAPDGSPPQTG